jgi:CheY-like chemotaxis protein
MNTKPIKILWTDDEIDLLQTHIMFLEQKLYKVDVATNGSDAIKMVEQNDYDIIFLDENMPGLTGLETLEKIKTIKPYLPVVLITKSEEENIMDEAIGSKVSDYLIKPVNPNQILLVLKKYIDKEKLVSQKISSKYQSEFSKIGMEINENLSYEEWKELYKRLTFWEIELENSQDKAMDEILQYQINEANNTFSKFIKKNYKELFNIKNDNKPLLSPNLLREKVFPSLKENRKTVFLLVDNLRYDQWKIIEPMLVNFYTVVEEDLYYSILPTATQYARNSLFSGLMPSEIDKLYPELWKNDDEEGGKNLYEEEMLKKYLQRFSFKSDFAFEKIIDINYTKKLIDNYKTLINKEFICIVVNFIDALSHARTDQKIVKDLAANTSAYRALTKSWFEHSLLLELLQILAEYDIDLIISTDHGSIQVENPVKIVADRTTTSNLRYKQGKNLSYNPKEVFEILNPAEVYLPKNNISSTYVFAMDRDFFVYPNNYNYYVKYYSETFQHGGVSLQEMIVPVVKLKSKLK